MDRGVERAPDGLGGGTQELRVAGTSDWARGQEWQFRGLGRIMKVPAERLDFTLQLRNATEGC